MTTYTFRFCLAVITSLVAASASATYIADTKVREYDSKKLEITKQVVKRPTGKNGFVSGIYPIKKDSNYDSYDYDADTDSYPIKRKLSQYGPSPKKLLEGYKNFDYDSDSKLKKVRQYVKKYVRYVKKDGMPPVYKVSEPTSLGLILVGLGLIGVRLLRRR